MTRSQLLKLFAVLVLYTVSINYLVLQSYDYSCEQQSKIQRAAKQTTDFAWGTAIGYLNPAKNYSFSLPQVPTSSMNQPLSICIATMEFKGLGNYYGGIGSANYELAKTLLKAGHNVKVLYLDQASKLQSDSIEIDGKKVPTFEIDPPKYRFEPSWFLGMQYRILQWFVKHSSECQITHFHDWFGYGYLTLLAKKQGWLFQNNIFIVTCHGNKLWAQMGNQEFPSETSIEVDFYEKKQAELADIVVSPSYYLLEYLRKHSWNFPPHTYVIQNAMSLPIQIEDTEALNKQNNYNKINELVFFGRIEPRKGTETFLKAIEMLGSDFIQKYNIKITFLGSGEGQALKLRNKIKNSSILKNIEAKFIHTFGRDEAHKYLKNENRIAVMPSTIENSPYTVLECIAKDIRFIASSVGGIPELIHPDFRDYVLFNPFPLSLTNKIKDIIELNKLPNSPVKPTVSPDITQSLWTGLHQWSSKLIDKKNNEETITIKQTHKKVLICITDWHDLSLLKLSLQSIQLQSYPNIMVVLDPFPNKQSDTYYDTDTFGREILPIIESNNWILLKYEKNKINTSMENMCASTYPNSDYLVFLSGYSLLKSNYIEKLMNITSKMNVDVISVFRDIYLPMKEGSFPSKSAKYSDRYVYGYSSGTITSAIILHKLIGNSPIFISRKAFEKLPNGITQYYNVGSKYVEFLESVLLNNLQYTVVPDPLVWIHKNSLIQQEDSTSFNNEYYNTLRRLDPIINHPDFSNIHELFLILQNFIDKSQNPPPEIIAKSNRDFSGKQHKKNWQYGFLQQNEFIVSPHFNGEKWLIDSQKEFPFLARWGAHPAITNQGDPISAVLRWISNDEGDFMLILEVQKVASKNCGDGVKILVTIDDIEYIQRIDATGDWKRFDIEIHLEIGSVVALVIDPLQTADCDTTYYNLEVVQKVDK